MMTALRRIFRTGSKYVPTQDERREEMWRDLAARLFKSLHACQPFMGLAPKLPTKDQLEVYAEEFRRLSRNGGWTP